MPSKASAYLLSSILLLTAGLSRADDAGPITFSAQDRVLIVAPHPDDETIGCGGVMQQVKAAGGSVKVVYLTHGDGNELSSLFYEQKPLLSSADFIRIGHLRSEEAIEAMRSLGVPRSELVFLGYPDLGLLKIWSQFWTGNRAYRSGLTRINSVPYPDDLSYGAAYSPRNITEDLKKVLAAYRPTQTFVTAPFDLNSDHRGAYLFLNLAMSESPDSIRHARHFVYVVHAHHWPKPRGDKPELELNIPKYVTWFDTLTWTRQPLTAAQVDAKKRALLLYKSQAAYMKGMLVAFAKKSELFVELKPGRVAMDTRLEQDAGAVLSDSEKKYPRIRYRVSGNELWVDIRARKPLDSLGALELEIFPYAAQTPFERMPKWQFKLIGKRVQVRNNRALLNVPIVRYTLVKDRLWVRIPLSRLKFPELIFASLRTYKDALVPDLDVWQILTL